MFIPLRPLQSVCSNSCAYDLAYQKVEERIKKKNAVDKKIWNKEKAILKIETHSKEYKKELQKNINLLARMIDAKFGYTTCICCNRDFGKQCDGAHFHSVGSNSSLRYNLHNIHSANSYCNNYSNTHISDYKIGLEKRYGKEYFEYVVNELPLKYQTIKLSSNEIFEKLKLVRNIIKNFNSYVWIGSENTRTSLNNLIGIYK
tara:strand:+ start:240 stop:845 length:606 start_codon:yes stop_codon:yes gene_type:complete